MFKEKLVEGPTSEPIGEDPVLEKQDRKKRLSVAELYDQYLQHCGATKKASTLPTDRGRIERHIKPLLGHKKVQDATRADVKRFWQDIAQGKTANGRICGPY